MIQSPNHCPECNAPLPDNTACEDHFHQMLYWEAEYPEYGIVHHLMVLCYHLQHPSLYSPHGLDVGKRLLTDFLERGLTTEEVRQRNQAQVDSVSREWKITARPGSFGAYERPVHWTMTAADVVAHGAERYVASVRDWAQSVLDALQSSDNLASTWSIAAQENDTIEALSSEDVIYEPDACDHSSTGCAL